MDVSGGSPIVLADASDADAITTGGSWSADGTIIFGAPQGIYRVSASGGAPALIAPVNTTLGETGYGAPQFLPDGDRFLMFVRSEDPARAGLPTRFRPDRKTLLLPTKSKALFVANDTGTRATCYTCRIGRCCQGVDQRTLALSGDPVVVASNVALFPPGFHASFWSSASGNLLGTRTEASDKPRLTWVYSDGKRQTRDRHGGLLHVRARVAGWIARRDGARRRNR